MNVPVRVMAHLIAGYPDDPLAFAIADSLVGSGVSYLEVQIPFSDPSADGVAIQKASSEVLSRGYTMSDNLRFVEKLASSFPDIPIFVMTYANLAYRRGVDSFVTTMAGVGVKGLIIPDLPFDYDEGLNEACKNHGMYAVPVAAPSMDSARRDKLTRLQRKFVYAALRAGITGSETVIDPSMIEFLDDIRGNSLLLGGFGIRSGQQSKLLAPHVHAVVAGSVFVNIIARYAPEGEKVLKTMINEKARELTGLA
ncbi:tryptophan synthase subunit alpha [Pleomorphochaeta sp. DL1XJH-081]|jgi:tryptophan synthase alpha chain|uniref:tryptophan synthase subunit alpha n=1 Tax=Pleomorphochaeta sp. DL1XJH-081 TaxID=3409690 RepID=UPI003BB78A73